MKKAIALVVFLVGCGKPPQASEPVPAAPRRDAFRGERLSDRAAILRFLDPVQVDFGTLRHGTGPQVRRVRFENAGSAPLVIGKIDHTCCGCIQGRSTKGLLEPGETAEIEITLDPSRRKGSLQIQITVEAHARDPVPPIVATAKVVDDIEPVPAVADFRTRDEAEVLLVNHAGFKDLKIEGVEKTLPVVEIASIETVEQGIRVRLRLTKPVDELVGCVRLRTNAAAWPVVTIGVSKEAP